MKTIKNKWMIEVLQPSNTCPFAYMKDLKTLCTKWNEYVVCEKETCPIKIGGNHE